MISAQNLKFEFVPVVIIGAGRSGTNILRDTLSKLEGFETWPCDEINPIWRAGNVNFPNDELPAEMATPKIKSKIRRAFVSLWLNKKKPKYVIEKTCANSLRISFVNAILPEAKFIYISRNGHDVVASAEKRWAGDMEIPTLPYLLAKSRYTPLFDLPWYAYRYLNSRILRVLGRSERLKIWGPRFEGIESLAKASTTDICAHQWHACIVKSEQAFLEIEPSRVMRVDYDSFTRRPNETVRRILNFLDADVIESSVERATKQVRKPVGEQATQANLTGVALAKINEAEQLLRQNAK